MNSVCTVDVLTRLRDKLIAVILVLPNSGVRKGVLFAFRITRGWVRHLGVQDGGQGRATT